MKNIVIISISIILLFYSNAKSQTKSIDTLYMMSGEKVYARVTKISENEVTYIYKNENLENNVSKSKISKIAFASGRQQIITNKVIINGEADWEKVVITNVAADVNGLKNKGEVYGEGKGGLFGNAGGHDLEKISLYAEEKIKREAASKGAHVVFIQSKTMKPFEQNAAGNFTPAKVTISGAAYGYE